MPLLPPDDRLLDRALELAQGAAAFASPNPAVGCVLVRDGMILGEGAHRYDNRDHAEIAALKAAAAAGLDPRGATALVTLEPCSHHGRTGPCADALIAAGITRCLVGTVDPNPLVRGSGLARLQSAGIQVEVADPASALGLRARRLNEAFAFSVQHGRPFVTMKVALSLDGKIAPSPDTRNSREPVWLTGTAARADVAQLRHRSDALLTGIGTVLADDPQLTDRTFLPRRRPLLRVVLDSALRLPESTQLVQQAAGDLLVFCNADADPERRARLERHHLEVQAIPDLHAPSALHAILTELQGRQVRSLMTEAGSALNGALLDAGLVDEVVLYYADVELGSDAVPFAEVRSPYELQKQLTSQSRRSFPNGATEDVRISGYLHDPWSGV